MHHPNEPIMYSKNDIFRLNGSPNQCFFKAGSEEIKKLRNTTDFFTHIVTQIMQYISLIDYKSPKHINYSMSTSLTGFPIKNIRNTK